MKFPFDFNITLIFRLVFPGIVLAAATLPALLGILNWMGIKAATEPLTLPVAAVFFGWLIVLGDQPIYMLLEGRRYLPAWLLERMRKRQANRLESLQIKSKELTAAGQKELALECDVRMLEYPIGENGQFFAQMPTRLGNLVYSYETYSNRAYKIDSIFYWYRLWLVLDKDLRSELTETQAIVDSAVYVCFASYISAGIVLLYAVGGFVAILCHRVLFSLPYLPSPGGTLLIGAILLVLGRFFYGLSMFAQRSYGELYKSLFDQFRDKLAFVDGVAQIAVVLGADPVEAAHDKFRVTSRYLRWHRIRPPGEKNITPEDWAARNPQIPEPISTRKSSLWSWLVHCFRHD